LRSNSGYSAFLARGGFVPFSEIELRSVQNEIAQDGESSFGFIWNHTVTTISEAPEPDQMPRQRGYDRFAESDGRNRVAIPTHYKHRATDGAKSGSEIHSAMLVVRAVEPKRDVVLHDCPLERVEVTSRPSAIERDAYLDVLRPALGVGSRQ